MKKQILVLSLAALVMAGSSCKNKTKPVEPAPTTTTAPSPAPVIISADDSLKAGVTDATKDYPGVSTSVSEGVITVTGTIQRDRLQPLIQSLQSLRPKRIENKLTIN